MQRYEIEINKKVLSWIQMFQGRGNLEIKIRQLSNYNTQFTS